MSATEYAVPPIKMPSGTARPAQSSRSSRRGGASTAPKVVLGGGVGALGTAASAAPVAAPPRRSEERVDRGSPFLTSPAASPLLPTQIASQPTTTPPLPSASTASSSYSVTSSRRTTAPRKASPTRSKAPSSSSSLSTTASTSSRALKTPHGKDGETKVAIASSSGSHEGVASPPPPGVMEMSYVQAKRAPGSPSPNPNPSTGMGMGMEKKGMQAMQDPARSSGERERRLPTVAPLKGDLPPVPPLSIAARSLPNRVASTHPSTLAGKSLPQHPFAAPKERPSLPPLISGNEKKGSNRLSQDWVQIPLSMASQIGDLSPTRRAPPPPRVPPAHTGRLPPAGSIPITGGSPPMRRPSIDRAATEPVSPTPQRNYADGGRKSLDQLRSASPTPQQPRKTSMSTPAAAMFEVSLQPLPAPPKAPGMLKTFSRGEAAATPSPPPLRTRRSADILRPSMDMFGGSLGRKEAKAAGKASQQELGNGLPSSVVAGAEDRKGSGLSLKKSSGALKALFNRNVSGKGKEREREATPPMPSLEERQASMATSMVASGRKSSMSDQPRPSFSRPRTPSANSPIIGTAENTPTDPRGRSSFTSERSTPVAFPLSRTASGGATTPSGLGSKSTVLPTGGGDLESVRTRQASRELPPLPHDATPSGCTTPVQTGRKIVGTPRRLPPGSSLDDTDIPSVPVSDTETSLAYMARASYYNSEDAYAGTAPRAPTPVGQSSLGLGLDTPYESPNSRKPLPTVKSLHLLALPDLDLKFDVSFDSIGTASPTTPRRPAVHRSASTSSRPSSSPHRSRELDLRSSPHLSPSASGSASNQKNSQSHGEKKKTERRRSQSFDGNFPGGSSTLSELWLGQGEQGTASFIPPNMAKLFANPTSSSAPLLSKQLADLSARPSPSSTTSDLLPTLSLPSHATASTGEAAVPMSLAPSMAGTSSSDTHGRSLSNASSASEMTPSPSPPRTPPDVRRFEPGPPLPTRSGAATEGMQKQVWQAGVAPTIPLPAPPVSFELSIPGSTATQTLVQVKRSDPENSAAATTVVPSLPSPPARAEDDATPKPAARPPAPPLRARTLAGRSTIVHPDVSRETWHLTAEIERLLRSFRYPSQHTTGADRASMLRTVLTPTLAEVDKRVLSARDERTNGPLREVAFQWADALLYELRIEQQANERGACLESLAAVMECTILSERALMPSPNHQRKFTQLMMRCMTFVMAKLGAKGVFHNTLLFSGRFLAFAFFRVPHVAEQLITVLQPPRGAIMRFTRSILVDSPKLPASAQPQYPAHLAPLCFDDSRSYTARIAKLSPDFADEEEQSAFLFQAGNWLRRWQSDDSELFPAFYRAYHRQLAQYLGPVVEHFESLNQPVPAAVLLRAPGYAHLATIFATKCHSYILGSVNAVTTSSSANNFEAQETAGFRGSQKPAVLETANRRLVETISTFANLRMTMPASHGRIVDVEGGQIWGSMIDAWTRSLISKTSLYAPKGVFSLFDLLDGIIDPPFDSIVTASNAGSAFPDSLLDVPHLIYTVGLILREGEHALTLVKAIAFVFTHWEALTARAEDRRELCLGLLLKKDLFERLLLFWSQSVRSYVLRLVVFRLGHIHTHQEDGEAHIVEIESVKLLQTRLDRIKRRHDELEPKPASDADSAPHTPLHGLSHSKSTIMMVDSPQVELPPKAERLLGLGLGLESKDEDDSAGTSKAAKATKWLKKRVGAGKKSKKISDSASRSASPSPSFDSSPVFGGAFSPSQDIGASPRLASGITPRLPLKSSLASPLLPSPGASSSHTGSDSSTSPVDAQNPGRTSRSSSSTRKGPPPTIMTTPHSPELPLRSPRSPTTLGVSFEFELPTASPRSDAFDRSPIPSHGSGSPRRLSQPPSPTRGPTSPHMSRSFSKRSSLLPPSTASALEGILAATRDSERKQKERAEKERRQKEEEGYPKRLHAYAIRMLAELEDAQKEYDEWWSENGVGRMDGAPPRLTVAWPFHDGDD